MTFHPLGIALNTDADRLRVSWWLRAPGARSELRAAARGSAQSGRKKIIHELEVPS
jgi:hypothetical protein